MERPVQKIPMAWRQNEHANLLDLILMECMERTPLSLQSIAQKLRSTLPGSLQRERPLKSIKAKALSLLSGDQQNFSQNFYSVDERVKMNYWLKIPLSKQLVNELLKKAVFQLDDDGCIVYYRRGSCRLGEEDTEKPHRMRVPEVNVLLFFLRKMKTCDKELTNEGLAKEFMKEYQYNGSVNQFAEKFGTLKTTGIQFNVADHVGRKFHEVARESISREFEAWIRSLGLVKANQPSEPEPSRMETSESMEMESIATMEFADSKQSNESNTNSSDSEPNLENPDTINVFQPEYQNQRNASGGTEEEWIKSSEPVCSEQNTDSNKEDTDSDSDSEDTGTITDPEPESRKRKASEDEELEKDNLDTASPSAEDSDDDIMWIADCKSTNTDRRSKKAKREDGENDFQITHSVIVRYGPSKVAKKPRTKAKKQMSDPIVAMNYELINQLVGFQEQRKWEASEARYPHILILEAESPVVLDDAEKHLNNLKKNIPDSKREGRQQDKSTVSRPNPIEVDSSEIIENEDCGQEGSPDESTPSTDGPEALSDQIGDSSGTGDVPSYDIVERHIVYLRDQNDASKWALSSVGTVDSSKQVTPSKKSDDDAGSKNQEDGHVEPRPSKPPQSKSPKALRSKTPASSRISPSKKVRAPVKPITLDQVKEGFRSKNVLVKDLILHLHRNLAKLNADFLKDLTTKAELASGQIQNHRQLIPAKRVEYCLMEIVRLLKDDLSIVMCWNGSLSLEESFTFLSDFGEIIPNTFEHTGFRRKRDEVLEQFKNRRFRVPANTACQAVKIIFKLCEINEEDIQI